MLKIIIPDPGLREYGGHHPGMINAIAHTQAVMKGSIQLEVYCNNACPNSFIEATQSKHVSISKHFTTDFYQYFYQSPSLLTLNHYINHLTHEYLTLFNQHKLKEEREKNAGEQSKTLFLYHTLNADHAIALASAIALYNKVHNKALHHCIFLMFNPVKRDNMGVLNNPEFLKFKLGFSLLKKQCNTQFYAAEKELQQNYQYLLYDSLIDDAENEYLQKTTTQTAKNILIPIHPCGLITQADNHRKKTKTVILFTGDAKVTKGFLSLPSLVEKLTKDITTQDVTFIIQYTITNAAEALKRVDQQLKHQASKDTRIQLTTHFWSHTELHETFASANCILLNYHNSVYQNQSSGILWLAAFYNLNMVFLTRNWLMREAKKLGCDYKYCSQANFSGEIYNYLKQTNKNFAKVTKNKYRNQLFQDIGQWLLNNT